MLALTPQGGAFRFRAREKGAARRPLFAYDRSMADSRKPPRDDALAELRRKVDAARRSDVDANTPPENAARLAFKFGGEFGAAILVGAAIGYGIGYWVHAPSWGLVVGLGLGFCAGVVNVMRTAQAYSREHPVDPNASSAADDED
jgi:ATP synthase protein I